MTVEEAKTKRCPFADQATRVVLCHTTECMAWRFDPQYAEPSQSYSGFSRPTEPEFLGYSNTEGYCIRLST